MVASLIQLAKNGQNLPLVDASEISYSPNGSVRLALIEENHFWFTSRRRAVLSLLRASLSNYNTNHRIGLDIGCGTGSVSVFLTENGLPTIGLDAYKSFSSYQKAGRGFGFLQGDIFSVNPKEEFDFLLLLDVLEHIPNDDIFLEQSFRFLKPEGVAIITAPAFPQLWSSIDEASGHLRRYTKKSMRHLINSLRNVATIEKESYFYGSTLPLYLASRLRRASAAEMSKKEVAPSRLVNQILTGILEVERRLMQVTSIPIGSSLFVQLRKTNLTASRYTRLT